MGDDENEDEDGGIEWDRVRAVLLDDGIRWRRAVTAVRREVELSALGWFGAAMVLMSYALFFSEDPSNPVTGGLTITAVALLFGGMLVARAVSDYYEHDEEVAIKELREQYADGDLSFAEFRRRVDRVIDGDDDVDVFADDLDGTGDGADDGTEERDDPGEPTLSDSPGATIGRLFDDFQREVERAMEEVDRDRDRPRDGGTGDPTAGADDPEAILRARYARGEIDEAEFHRRLSTLRATGEDEDDRDREFAFET